MTDLLTKEERAVLDSVRGANKLRIELSNCGPATEDCDKLIAIFDNLSKRGVKKYSEDELRAAFEAQPVETVFPERNQEHIIGKVALHAWIECARFLGALQEK